MLPVLLVFLFWLALHGRLKTYGDLAMVQVTGVNNAAANIGAGTLGGGVAGILSKLPPLPKVGR